MIDVAPAMGAALAAVVIAAAVAIAWPRPIGSILSLSGASLALAVAIYLAGYPIAAVFEATVAAGLVGLLFLFVVDLTGGRHVPRGRRAALAVSAILAVLAAVGLLARDVTVTTAPVDSAASFWAAHPLDVLLVAVLVLVGVLGVVRLAGPGGESA